MADDTTLHEYLVLSRGKWDRDASPERIQRAIDDFYAWLEGLVAAGRARRGQRLDTGGRMVGRGGVTDGPFAEAREVVGGYWFFLAPDLDAAAVLAAQNPCLACGLQYEVRPVDPRPASAWAVTNETPAEQH